MTTLFSSSFVDISFYEVCAIHFFSVVLLLVFFGFFIFGVGMSPSLSSLIFFRQKTGKALKNSMIKKGEIR